MWVEDDGAGRAFWSDCRQPASNATLKLSKATADPSLRSRMTLLSVEDDGVGRAFRPDRRLPGSYR